MKTKTILYLSVFLLLISCKKGKPSNYQDYLNEQMYEHYAEFAEKYNKVVIIPRTGCHTCKDYADLYFKENKNNEDHFFIFTKLISKKQLTIELGKETLEQENVKIDNDNLFYSIEYLDSEYPLLLTKKANGVFEYSLLE